jgi:hypothetical protein
MYEPREVTQSAEADGVESVVPRYRGIIEVTLTARDKTNCMNIPWMIRLKDFLD